MWKLLHASAIGSSHILNRLPCQDAHVVEQIGSSLILVASDGAGSCIKAHEGSLLACQIAKSALIEAAKKKTLPNREEIVALIKTVQKEMEAKAASSSGNLRDYSCTLLGALITQNGSCFFQIGDGTMIQWPSEQNGEVIFWPPKFEYANQTVFVTDIQALETLQVRYFSHPIVEVALLTDGLEKIALLINEKRVFEPFFRPFRTCLKNVAHTNLELNQKLDEFLNSSAINQRTDDDKTLIVAQFKS